MEIPKGTEFVEVESLSFSSEGGFGGTEGSVIKRALEHFIEVIVECISVNWIIVRPRKASKLYVRHLYALSTAEEMLEIKTPRSSDLSYEPTIRLSKRGNSFFFSIGFSGKVVANISKPTPESSAYFRKEFEKKGFLEKKEVWIASNEPVCPDLINVLPRLLHIHVEYSSDDNQGRAQYCITPLYPDSLYYKEEFGGRKVFLATSTVRTVELLKTPTGYCVCVENNVEFI